MAGVTCNTPFLGWFKCINKNAPHLIPNVIQGVQVIAPIVVALIG